MIRSLAGLIAGITAAVLFGGCDGSRNDAGPGRKLHVYTWADYFEEDLLKAFEDKYDCTVVIDTFDSNETMMAKLQAGASGYDVLTPTSYQVKAMNRLGMLLPLDHAKLANAKAHIDPAHLAQALDPGMEVSVPYMIGTTVITYRTDKLAEAPADYSAFLDPAVKGKATLFDDMREVLGAGLKSLGYSLNSTDPAEIDQARQQVMQWKANIAKFDSEQYKSGIDSGEFILSMAYSGDILQVMEENADVAIVVPQSGAARSCDDFVIARDAPDAELAHAFIDYWCSPEVAAANTDYLGFLAPNKDAYPLMSEDTRNNPAIFPPADIAAKCEFIDDLGDAVTLYQQAWDRIIAGE